MFEQPMWQTFLRLLRLVTEADGVAIVLTGTGEAADVMLREGEPIDPPRTDMRVGRVYSGNDLAHPESALRAISVRGDALALTLIVLARDAPGAEIGSLLSALVPHLQVALKVLESIDRERGRASVGAEAFRRMNFGWIALDERCRIVDLDGQADSFLQRSGALRRGPYNRLIPSSPSVDRQLTSIAKAMAADSRHRPQAINIGQDPWIDILVVPMRIDALAGESKAVAVIYLRGDRSSSADRHEQLVDLFDLTPAEARLAWSLAQGLTIAEAAEAHGLTVETARYYSKRIYAKTGARGQVDLVRNILTGVLALA
ncbi:helix-turn-helix transcriptional regulator [Qipengyuania sp. 6D47A]|uniref:Helix-turn-helix transcriptional regulator n=2 Tax=Qipengyuania qiaonensis TaxID=2867240 RepID=A0ABS7J801_9SPHN|nr:helix-turn-helix transcriptional regulator [Qipengyuania qiaonensis]